MIRNFAELQANHGGKPAHVVLSALNYTLNQVDPALLVRRSVEADGQTLKVRGIRDEKIRIKNVDRIYVVGAGKACSSMAISLCKILGDRVTQGAITIPRGDKNIIRKEMPSVLDVAEGAHPIPDSSALTGSKKIVTLLSKAGENDLIFVLISGGGSAMLPLPAPGLRLIDKQRITNKLLKSGATIQELNIVRKHLSAIKGGQLLRHTGSCRVVTLILSDVIDDDFTSIASGPTSPDPSTFADAVWILEKYRLAATSDPAVGHIMRGARGLVEDTPKPGEIIFENVHNVLIGNNEVACMAATTFLRQRGIRTAYLGSRFSGEARDFGSFLARLAGDLGKEGQSQFALVLGGETTVTIKGKAGRGGRNQEAALSCAMTLPPGPLVACMGTDGIDGTSNAAGSLISSTAIDRVKRKKIDLARFLRRHDSYTALKATGSLIYTGRTGTNVNDIALIYSPPSI